MVGSLADQFTLLYVQHLVCRTRVEFRILISFQVSIALPAPGLMLSSSSQNFFAFFFPALCRDYGLLTTCFQCHPRFACSTAAVTPNGWTQCTATKLQYRIIHKRLRPALAIMPYGKHPDATGHNTRHGGPIPGQT